MKYIVLFLFSVFISSVSQILLKSSAKQQHEKSWKDYLNWKVIVAYGVFAYRYVPLSMGPILEASGYLFVAVLGYFILKERIGKRKWLGLSLILAGIVVAYL